MAYDIPYDGNLKWLKGRTIFYVVHGSRCYGTSRRHTRRSGASTACRSAR